MMSMVDRLAAARRESGRGLAPSKTCSSVAGCRFPAARCACATEVTGGATRATSRCSRGATPPTRALALRARRHRRGARSARPRPPPPFAPLDGPHRRAADPYASGSMFHGPAFHYLTELRMGATGSSARAARRTRQRPARPSASGSARRRHARDSARCLWHWSDRDSRATSPRYPHRIPELRLHAPLPDSGEVRVEVALRRLRRRSALPDVRHADPRPARVRARSRSAWSRFCCRRGPIGIAPRRGAPRVPARSALRRRRGASRASTARTTGLSDADVRAERLAARQRRAHLRRARRAPRRCSSPRSLRANTSRTAPSCIPSAVTRGAGFRGARAAMRPLRRHPLHVPRASDDVARHRRRSAGAGPRRW